jgi:APA family basic amino acid/polyamine antiporter
VEYLDSLKNKSSPIPFLTENGVVLKMADSTKVYVRTKSGLVRAMSPFDALLLNIVCISFFSASIFAFQMTPLLFPGANVAAAFILAIIFSTPLYLTWGMLASSMPRSGGDYVFTSRLVHPALAFIATFSAWVFWQWWYQGTFPMQITFQSIAPFLTKLAIVTGNMSYMNAGAWATSTTGLVVIGVVLLVIALLLAIPGIRFYALVQRAMFILAGLAVLALLYVLVVSTPETFANNLNHLLTQATGENIDWYHTIIEAAATAGYAKTEINLYDTLGTVPVTMMCMGYGFWSIMVMGEVKEARSAKLVNYSILGSVTITGVFFAILYALMTKVAGYDFYNAFFYLYMVADPIMAKIPFTPNYMFLGMVVSPNIAFDFVIALGSALNVFNLMIQMYIVGSRVMFAQTFDRILPEKLSHISTKYISPVNAIIVYFFGSLIWLVIASFNPLLYFYFTAVVLGVILTYILDSVAGIVFPYKMKDTFEASPIAKYKIGGLPAIVLTGIGGLVFSLFLLYFYVTVPGLGLTNPTSIGIVLAVYVVLLVYYYAIRWYRQKYQGINIDLAFKEIPPE